MKDHQNLVNLDSKVIITLLTNFLADIGVEKAVSPSNWWKPRKRFKLAMGGIESG
jgi:hypothetical protein